MNLVIFQFAIYVSHCQRVYQTNINPFWCLNAWSQFSQSYMPGCKASSLSDEKWLAQGVPRLPGFFPCHAFLQYDKICYIVFSCSECSVTVTCSSLMQSVKLSIPWNLLNHWSTRKCPFCVRTWTDVTTNARGEISYDEDDEAPEDLMQATAAVRRPRRGGSWKDR